MKLPEWFKQNIPNTELLKERVSFFKELRLNTVCQGAHCPNIGDCSSRNQATFMILGASCTRNCGFCAVEKGIPQPIDSSEPQRVAEAVKKLELDYVVITSVTRDDLSDGGAGQFAKTIKAIRDLDSNINIEVLIPDFRGNTKKYVFNADKHKSNADTRRFNLRPFACNMRESALKLDFSMDSLKIVLDAKPDVLGHNIETVPRLYSKVRPQADYKRSLLLLKKVKENSEDILTHSATPQNAGSLFPRFARDCSRDTERSERAVSTLSIPKLNLQNKPQCLSLGYANVLTKSAIMLGLGESLSEILECIQDLRGSDCDILVLGQYLAPSAKHIPVKRFYSPKEFKELKEIARLKGFKAVLSGPLVRSSYKAKEIFQEFVECTT